MEKQNNKCRVCFCVDTEKLFDWHKIMDACENLTYAECFQRCTQLSLDDAKVSLPQKLCRICAEKLSSLHNFIKKAKNSDYILRNNLNNIIPSIYAVENFEWVGVEDKPPIENNVIENKNNTDDQCIQSKENGETTTDSMEKFDPSNCVYSDKKESNNDAQKKGTLQIKPKVCLKNSKRHLTTHMEPNKKTKRHRALEQNQKEFLCHACPRTFKDAHTLQKHTLIHQENRERKYSCKHCDKKFYTQGAYYNHNKIHETNRKPVFQCDQCEKCFFHKGSLKLHQQRHNGQTIECHICQKEYLRQVDLEIHMRSHSGDTPYKCPHCEKAFPQVSVLNKHVRAHEGVRYKCDICLKQYTHQSSMIQHRLEHTGLPLRCSLCSKGFVKKSKMQRHITNVHKIKETVEVEQNIIKVKTDRIYRGRIRKARK